MGQRGPKRTPTALLQARGSWLGKQRAVDGEPVALPFDDTPPPWLTTEAVAAWRTLVAQLSAVRILSATDRIALARYVQGWSRWLAADAIVQREGMIVDGANGARVPHPAATLALKLGEQLARLEATFGLTPSSRSGLRAAPEPPTPSPADRHFGTGA